VDSPAEGAQFENGAIPVRGTTSNATTVTIKAVQTKNADGTPVATLAPPPSPPASPGASARPSASPGPSAAPVLSGPTVGPVTVDVTSDGTFDSPLELSAGSWQLVVTATSAEGKAVTLTRNVAIVYKGVNLVVSIKGSTAWLKVWVDGKVSKVTGAAGTVYDAGKVLTFTARDSVEVRTGKSSATYFTLNGDNLGRMSNKSNPETWLFAPPNPPVRTNRN
jgi:hypothetical protein